MQSALTRPHVIIYSRPGCHLCDEAKQTIAAAGCSDEYTLTEIDIESEANLLERYKFDVPVITINGIEAFKHRLSVADFKQALARFA